MPKRPPKDAPDPIDRHVGSRVRERRVGLRISQTRLGDAIGVTFQQIQKYENGANRISASNLLKMARVLGVEVGFFFEGVDEITEDQSQPKGFSDAEAPAFEGDPLNSREGIELVYSYFRIQDPAVQRRLFELVRSLRPDGGE